MLVAALRSAGVTSFTKLADVAAGAYGIPGSGGPVEVWVDADDLERANEVLTDTGR